MLDHSIKDNKERNMQNIHLRRASKFPWYADVIASVLKKSYLGGYNPNPADRNQAPNCVSGFLSELIKVDASASRSTTCKS